MSLNGLKRSRRILGILCLLCCSSYAFADNIFSTEINTALRSPEFISGVNHLATPKTTAHMYNSPVNFLKRSGRVFHTNSAPTGFAGQIGTPTQQ